GELDLTEGIHHFRSTGIAHGESAVGVFQLRPAAHSGDFGVAEGIAHPQGRGGGHGDVVVHGKGGVAADADVRYAAFRIDRTNVYAVAFFFDLDLDLLQKILSVAGVRILHLDGRGNFHLAPAFAVNIYPTEAVIEAYALTATERNCFLEVAGDLVL